MEIILIAWVIAILLCVILVTFSCQEEKKQLIKFENEDDAFAAILSQIFRSKNESELRKTINLILAYDDQFNNEKDLDYFIEIWDKRMKASSKTKTNI